LGGVEFVVLMVYVKRLSTYLFLIKRSWLSLISITGDQVLLLPVDTEKRSQIKTEGPHKRGNSSQSYRIQDTTEMQEHALLAKARYWLDLQVEQTSPTSKWGLFALKRVRVKYASGPTNTKMFVDGGLGRMAPFARDIKGVFR